MREKLAVLLVGMLIVTLFSCNTLFASKETDTNKLLVTDLNLLPKTLKNILNVKNAKGASDIGKEDLYAIDLVNSDGSHTVSNFQFPIKYFEDDGSIQYIDNSIIPMNDKKYAYKNKANRIKTYFPTDIKEGILIYDDKYELSFTPITDKVKITGENKDFYYNKVTENVVEYENVFGEGTKLQYAPTYTGLKENIVLEKYNGTNTFKFFVDTKGLVPVVNNGESIALKDPASDEIVALIGQVDARDSYIGSNENNDKHFSINNKVEMTKTDKEGVYVLTVTVDKDFLESKTTVFPVVIDPTLTVYASNHIDTTVYSNYPNTQTFYTSSYNNVGNHGSSYGTGIALIRFNIDSSSITTTINPDSVTKAEYVVYEGSGRTNTSKISAFPLESTWNDSTITYNNVLNNSMINYNWALDYKVIKSSGWFRYNLTYITQGWLRDYYYSTGGSNDNKVSNYGFALVAEDSSQQSKHFCSAQHTSYPPRLEITYSTSFSTDYMSFTYNPSRFNNWSGLRSRMNCYGYALRVVADSTGSYGYFQQPGEFSDLSVSYPLSTSNIYSLVSSDLSELGFSIQQTTATSSVPSGYRKIAFAVDSDPNPYNNDYHFYVRHSDGTWSHKPGNTEVTNLDAQGVVITDSNIQSISKDYSAIGGNNYSDGTMYLLVTKNAVLDYVHTTNSSQNTLKTSERAGDTFIHAKTASVGSTISAKFDYGLDNTQDTDYYKIVISTSGNYSFYTSSNLDTYGQLYNSSGGIITKNDDYDGDTDFRINNYLSAGTYYVKVHPYYTSNYGSYSFVIVKN